MNLIEKINVSVSLEGEHIDVGEIVLSSRKIYFKYLESFIETGLNLSPITLPFNSQIHTAKTEAFDGLYGVFADSLPDGWGRLLLDRTLISEGVEIQQISPLDRLAFVGNNGMGALVYQPSNELDEYADINLGFDEIAREMNQVEKGESSELIEELFRLGGSSGGARPKIFVGFNRESNQFLQGEAYLPKGYDHWIIKFPSSVDNPEIAKIEFAYHKMALKAGLEMSESRLFSGKSGTLYFGTKRFDRNGNNRLHVHSATGLIHDNIRFSSMDYGHLMDAAFRLEKHVCAYEKVFRLAAFNVFAHNRDDHSKNFSFLMNGKGEWKFSPAYDLTFSNSSHGFHSTMIAGESKDPGEKDLMKLAEHFGLRNGKMILEEVKEAISEWRLIAKELDINCNTIKSISSNLNKKLEKK